MSRFVRSQGLLISLAIAGCGGSSGSSDDPIPAPAGTLPTPTSVIGTWKVTEVVNSKDQVAPADANVMQLEFTADGHFRFYGCAEPMFDGPPTRMACHTTPLCDNTGTYSVSGTTLTTKATIFPRSGEISFVPGGLVLGGSFFGPTYHGAHLIAVDSLPSDCTTVP